MQIKKIELTDEERKVLRMLARSGAMSPSKVSAETLILPGKTPSLLKNMAMEDIVHKNGHPVTVCHPIALKPIGLVRREGERANGPYMDSPGGARMCEAMGNMDWTARLYPACW